MFKVTPNPPDTNPASPYETLDSRKLHEAAERALDFYLNPAALMNTPRKPSTIFMIAPDVDDETLLVQACESMASASVMASDIAGMMEGSHRNTLLALQQVIMFGELAVNRMPDNLVPPT